jgi:3-oxoacyl-[acyl-carrier-protein] synthase-1
MAHRVVVTGMGIVSCIGNELDTVSKALREGRSGIRFCTEYQERGLKSQVAGIPDLSGEPAIDRKLRRFMGDAAVYAWHAMRKAIADAALPDALRRDERTALVIGSGVGSLYLHHEGIANFERRGLDKLLPYYVPQVMGSTVSANLAHAFDVGGPSYGITAACATSAHCIGNAFDMIRHGIVDRAFAGGAEEVRWTSTVMFDAMGALSTLRNDMPEQASRPFDAARDGFVIAGGAAVLLLESEEAARRRGARIHAELAGYGAASAGGDMVQPSPAAAARAMRNALRTAGLPAVSYINAHATSTPLGDNAELDAILEVFGEDVPPLSSTKGMTGHSIAASGAQEALYCLLMMRDGFTAGTANLHALDEGYEALPVLRGTLKGAPESCLSNSFGFGGTNAALVFRRH